MMVHLFEIEFSYFQVATNGNQQLSEGGRGSKGEQLHGELIGIPHDIAIFPMILVNMIHKLIIHQPRSSSRCSIEFFNNLIQILLVPSSF
jgi:hypothetical protein